MKWMSSDFATWQVEGQVMERVEYALKDAENWRRAKQAQNAKYTKKGLQKSARIEISWLYRLTERIRQVLTSKSAMSQHRPSQWNARVQR